MKKNDFGRCRRLVKMDNEEDRDYNITSNAPINSSGNVIK